MTNREPLTEEDIALARKGLKRNLDPRRPIYVAHTDREEAWARSWFPNAQIVRAQPAESRVTIAQVEKGQGR